jgi:hypothetical protein
VTCGRATGDSRVIGESKGGALLGKTRKAAQLERGAVQLAVQAGQAQAGLLVGQSDQRFPVGLQGGGQGIQQRGAGCAFAALPIGEGGIGGTHCGIDVGRRRSE